MAWLPIPSTVVMLVLWREPSRVLQEETARWRKRWSRASQEDRTTVQAPVQP